jgi:hypothetical protein
VSVESDKLRTQFVNLLNEIVYQLGFGPFANVWRAERVYPPTPGVAARNQRAYAGYLVKRVFRKPWSKCFSDFSIGHIPKAKHPCTGSQVRHGLEVPNNDGLLGHWLVELCLVSQHNTKICADTSTYRVVGDLVGLAGLLKLNLSTASRSPSHF